jgi:hypothetical protein
MEDVTLYLEISVIGITILLFLMTLLSYRMSHNPKVLILSAAFLIFAIKILLLLSSEYFEPLQEFGSINTLLIFDFIIVIIIYSSMIKK